MYVYTYVCIYMKMQSIYRVQSVVWGILWVFWNIPPAAKGTPVTQETEGQVVSIAL